MDDKEKIRSAVEVLRAQLEGQLKEVADAKRMINGLLGKIGDPPMFSGADAESSNGSGPPRPDQYYGKPLATAVQEILDGRRSAWSAEEILKALEAGGFDFRKTTWREEDRLRSLSISLAKNPKFHRLPSGVFGLANWYDLTSKAERSRTKASEAESSDEPEAPSGETENDEEQGK